MECIAVSDNYLEYSLDDSHTVTFNYVVTKTWNDLKPPKTIYNHLKKFNNHLQPPQKHP